ncbi:MAG: hypothetical protein ACPG4T_12030, partial [Nannocystaceae bacterium]
RRIRNPSRATLRLCEKERAPDDVYNDTTFVLRLASDASRESSAPHVPSNADLSRPLGQR